MSEFDKHCDGWAIASNCTEDEAKIHFKAGQQSQQAKIDNLQKENDRLNTSYKNVKLQFENKQIDCDRSDRKIDELQARIDEVLIEMKNQLGDEDFYDMEQPDYDAMLYALRNIKDILK